MSTAGALTRRARQEAGLTQRELAARLGVSQPVVARLESAGANPRLSTLRRVLRASGHDLDLELRPAASPVDETLIAANLRRSPADRLRAFATAYRNTAAMARRAKPVHGP